MNIQLESSVSCKIAYILTFQSTIVSLIADDDPKINCLFRSELFVVPLLLDAHRTICLNRHPWILITNLECFTFRLLFQLKDIAAFGVTVWLGELNSFRWTDGTSDASLLSWMTGEHLRLFGNVVEMYDNMLIVGVCGRYWKIYGEKFLENFFPFSINEFFLTFWFACWGCTIVSRRVG